MRMKKSEHARGDCIDDTGFFAFADPSPRDRVEGGEERPGESAKFAGFDFICSRPPLKAVHRQLAGKPRIFRAADLMLFQPIGDREEADGRADLQ
ncbi:hypothetical protein [Rhizobium leguminosarum]|nr:hypothetical protein [Rhizobium leguminosarum]